MTAGDKIAVTGGTGNDVFTLTGRSDTATALRASTVVQALTLSRFNGNATQTDLLNVKGIEQFRLAAGSTVDLTKQAAEVQSRSLLQRHWCGDPERC